MSSQRQSAASNAPLQREPSADNLSFDNTSAALASTDANLSEYYDEKSQGGDNESDQEPNVEVVARHHGHDLAGLDSILDAHADAGDSGDESRTLIVQGGGGTSYENIYPNDKINDYISKIRPKRDVLLYFTGRKSDFKNPIDGNNVLSKILEIPDGGEYVSKDAFPMSNDIINSIFKRGENSNFKSYTSQLMDPATQMKDIVSVEKKIKSKNTYKRIYLQVIYKFSLPVARFHLPWATGKELTSFS